MFIISHSFRGSGIWEWLSWCSGSGALRRLQSDVGRDLNGAGGLASKMAHSLGWQDGAVGRRPTHMILPTWASPESSLSVLTTLKLAAPRVRQLRRSKAEGPACWRPTWGCPTPAAPHRLSEYASHSDLSRVGRDSARPWTSRWESSGRLDTKRHFWKTANF